VQRVGRAGADEHVVARAAREILDVGTDVVALAGTAVVGAARERHAHAGRALAVVGEVAPGAAHEGVGSVAAGEAVVAAPAVEAVAGAVAGQEVVGSATRDVLDVALHLVALAAHTVVVAGADRDDHGLGRGGVVGRVAAGPADQVVLARRAAEHVVAAAALEAVVARAAGQAVVAGAAGEALHVAGDAVALAGLAVAAGGSQVDHDAPAARRVVGAVAPGAAGQRVRARAAVEDVVELVALQAVVARAAR
jgi:hypothetical protein